MSQPLSTDILLTSAQVKARFGGVSDMTIHRWLKRSDLRFPSPLTISKRRYWRLGELLEFEARQKGVARAA